MTDDNKLHYDDNKGAYTFIVVISFIVFMGIVSFAPFLLLFALVGGIVVALLLGADKAFEGYENHIKPKIDDFIDKENEGS